MLFFKIELFENDGTETARNEFFRLMLCAMSRTLELSETIKSKSFHKNKQICITRHSYKEKIENKTRCDFEIKAIYFFKQMLKINKNIFFFSTKL